MEVREDCFYTQEHQWVRREADDTVTVGITDYAQDLLSDIVYVELPGVGAAFGQGDEMAVAESVKAASTIPAPISGEVVEINAELEDRPEEVNEEPYDGGWLVRMSPASPGELDELIGPDAYRALCEADE